MAKGRIIALGYFDGVHMGHGGLLQGAVKLAEQQGCTASALTFHPHPSLLLTGKSVPLLSSVEERKELMKRLYGIDEVLVFPFTRERMTQPWEDFLRELVEAYDAKGLVCGHDFRFGYKGEGDRTKLAEFCEENGLSWAVIEEISVEGQVASSSLIRQFVAEGEMEKAVRFLGHPHLMTGIVEPGAGRGHTWGIPTANLPFREDAMVPALGVYATKATVDGKQYLAVTNVGVHPTVGQTPRPLAEAWLLDFEGDLYGKEISLEFYYRIREERKFPGVEEMAAEIRQNAQEVRKYFGK